MGRWERSKQLTKASWALLRHDKELMLLPLISGIASLAIGATFLVPAFLTAKGTDVAGETTLEPSVVSYVLLFAMYLALAYVAIFFKVAVLCGADQRMRGENPSLGSALSGASAHAGKLLPWAVVSATVSVILRAIEERVGLLGQIVVGIIGVAWAVVTFLVLPVLVFEGVGVGEAIKRSATMLKQTWGENLLVNMGIGLIAFLLILPAVVVAGGAAVTGSLPVIAVGVALAVAWVIAVTCWSTAMTAIFQLTLYRYATQAALPAEFATVDLSQAFRHKGARR
ncbi:MAG: hypothetical protein KDA98_00660 [Acidimicrobiales bacterium]|nr:hypothetical protein [Acidimicrobiales bacterium]